MIPFMGALALAEVPYALGAVYLGVSFVVVRGSSKMVLVVPLAAPPGSEAGTGVPAATVGRSQRCE